MTPALLTITCPVCRTPFAPRNRVHLYCSQDCKKKNDYRREVARIRRKREASKHLAPVPVRLLCPQCRTAYTQTQSAQKYCSPECSRAAQKKIMRKYCAVCGNQFGTTLPERTLCTRHEQEAEAKRKSLQAAQEALIAAIYTDPEDDPEPTLSPLRTAPETKRARLTPGVMVGACSSKKCQWGCRLGNCTAGAADYREEWSKP